MKVKETFTIEKKEERSFVTKSGETRKFNDYLIHNVLEREDGSLIETYLNATTTDSVGELEIGAKYNLTVFITSRMSTSDGTERHWPTFRVTAAEKIADAPKKAEQATETDAIGDDLPF